MMNWNRIIMQNDNYKDYSQVSANEPRDVKYSSLPASSPSSPCRMRLEDNKAVFAVKLHYMMSELEKDGNDNIIGWQPHGRCFLVRDRKILVESVITR